MEKTEDTRAITPEGSGSAANGRSPAPRTSSDRKVQASRINSTESTGPTTVAGKEAVSKNALKNGIYAQKWLAVTADEQAMVDDLFRELRQQFPARDLLDELAHEQFVQAYVQWWRFIQAYGGMMDHRRGQIVSGVARDVAITDSLQMIEERERVVTRAVEELQQTGRVAARTLTELEAALGSSSPLTVLIADLRALTAAVDGDAEKVVDLGAAQRLVDRLAKELADTKTEWQARIARQQDAAYRLAALPSDSDAKRFLRYERDTFRKLQRAAATLERRWGRAPVLPRPKAA